MPTDARMADVSKIAPGPHRAHAHWLTLCKVCVASRGSVILADTIVIVVTWMKMYRQMCDARRMHVRMSASFIITTDGTSAPPPDVCVIF